MQSTTQELIFRMRYAPNPATDHYLNLATHAPGTVYRPKAREPINPYFRFRSQLYPHRITHAKL